MLRFEALVVSRSCQMDWFGSKIELTVGLGSFAKSPLAGMDHDELLFGSLDESALLRAGPEPFS